MKKLLLLALVILPAFVLLLRPGIHTTHDYHVFRQHEFDLCAAEGSLPCRWSPDAGFGYGEPMFNFYGQAPYLFGRLLTLAGMSQIDAVKALFILSFVISALAMYRLAREFSSPAGSLLASTLYVVAPYRAVDVWVRGALPEALSFMFFPLILWVAYKHLSGKKRVLPFFALLLALLVITHNLSVYMFAPFLGLWTLYFTLKFHAPKRLAGLVISGLVSLGLVAFYLVPVLGESFLIQLNTTTQNYFFFALHYATLSQLLISRFWGYGGSTWGPNDSMSFSVGHIHWLIAAVTLGLSGLAFLRRRDGSFVWLLALLAGLAIFLTHGKSEFLWLHIPGMSYIQFPWRYLSQAVLFLSLLASQLPRFLSPRLAPVLVTSALLLYIPFFRPDIWQPISDAQLFSGSRWNAQRASTIQDYWPATSPIQPTQPAPSQPFLDPAVGTANYTHRGAHHFTVSASTPVSTTLILPQVIFPGWQFTLNNAPVSPSSYSELGLAAFKLGPGTYELRGDYAGTPLQHMAELVSLIACLAWVSWVCFAYRHET